MKREALYFVGIALFLWTMTSGCAVTEKALFKPVPAVQECSNEYYKANIEPIELRKGFKLFIFNKTKQELELDWNRTYFIANGQTSGGFMFEGIMYKDRNNPKPPDIIFPKKLYVKAIMPNNLVEYKKGWDHKSMGSGEYGVLLSIKVDEKEVREKMLIKFVPRWK
ncbi:MAG: hypothetical protein JRI71_11935 [Deltaproteobacteria bacterium]|nr:hypothetical protein [Deltaproteobacteria bacterium]